MEITETEIPDVKLIEPKVFGDERGFFMETWNQSDFREAGIEAQFVQENYSRSKRNTLRGLHYQIKQPQGKLVGVSRGEVLDVAVDLRVSSATFGKWVSRYLTEENKRLLWIPPGFAHGFLVLSKFADFQYKCTNLYAPQHERTIKWNDQELEVDWGVQKSSNLLLSEKDVNGISLKNAMPEILEHYSNL